MTMKKTTKKTQTKVMFSRFYKALTKNFSLPKPFFSRKKAVALFLCFSNILFFYPENYEIFREKIEKK